MNIRTIKQKDNTELAKVIRTVLKEFGIDKPGTVYTDPTTDDLHGLFQLKNAQYYVAEINGKIIGGCGIYPTEGLPATCTELVKLYLLPSYRNKGIGKELMKRCIDQAKTFGLHQIYLETMPELSNAVGLYQKLGFEEIDHSMGNSGHFACDLWMVKNL